MSSGTTGSGEAGPAGAPPAAKRKRVVGAWSTPCQEADWRSGHLNQLQPGLSADNDGGQSKRAWRTEARSHADIFRELQGRVDDCWAQSLAIRVCSHLADQLHQAMRAAPIEDHRLSVAGEKHRVLCRALALREVLLAQDPGLRLQQDGDTPPAVALTRSSNEAEPDATPGQCLLSVCMLLAALYEQTPWGPGTDVRRHVYRDFTLLKRHFRQDDLLLLRGRTTPIHQLFDALKDVDRTHGLPNLVGLVFEDWTVNSRVDNCILANQLDVEVLTLTSDGPIGKFKCKLRSLMTLNLLHQRLLKELFHGMFVGKPPPTRHHEAMTASDTLDFMDFIEAMARNVPQKHVEGTKLYYAWMYSPEVHATPEQWATIFGPGANTLPTLCDAVTTPDGAVSQADGDGNYSLHVSTAAKNDYLTRGSAQSAVGFPWADDLIGAYLRRAREGRLPTPHAQPQQAPGGTSPPPTTSPTSPPSATQLPPPGPFPALSGPSSSPNSSPAPAAPHPMPSLRFAVTDRAVAPADDVVVTVASAEPGAPGARLSLSPRQQWTMPARPGSQWADPDAPDEADIVPPPSGRGAAKKPQLPVHPIPNATDTGELTLPLGIFMVGIICSGAFTNTQIHVEDLLLMSININIFGAPKVWWWLPREAVQGFKEAAEAMTEGGRGELYTKSISPFLVDRDYGAPEHVLPLKRLKELGARRTIQMPGMGIWTMPGYAFHFTVSMGLNIAESANMFLEVMGWTFEKLWRCRPLEQYPELEDDMARYMRETGVLEALGISDTSPRAAGYVHKGLAPRLRAGRVPFGDGKALHRAVYSEVVKYRVVGSPASSESTATALTGGTTAAGATAASGGVSARHGSGSATETEAGSGEGDDGGVPRAKRVRRAPAVPVVLSGSAVPSIPAAVEPHKHTHLLVPHVGVPDMVWRADG